MRRIDELLVDGAFLCRPVGDEEVSLYNLSRGLTLIALLIIQDEIPYSHPALLETIVILFFPKKTRAMSVASLDLDAFDPMPLPTIALAACVVGSLLSFVLNLLM